MRNQKQNSKQTKSSNTKTARYAASKDTRKQNADSVLREQPKKDSKSKRANFDNVRIDKMKFPGYNDITWYSKNPTLLQAAASIPFASVLGAKLDPTMDQTVPGIMTFYWSPAIGCDQTGFPYAVNQAFKSMYSYLVHANSRNYSYEYQDLAMFTMAGAQIFSAISAVIRAYGFAKTYAEQTLYSPDALLGAMGFEANDFRNNLAQIWFDINEIIARTSQIWIPNTLPFIQRWFWMNANVYKDAADPKGQTYLFTQNCFWQLSETASTNGTSLVPYKEGDEYTLIFDPSRQQYKWANWKAMLNSLIDAMVNSEDRGIIMGDILNAYGADKIYALPQIPSDFRIEPVYNPEVLTQIENLTMTQMQQRGLIQTADGIKPLWQKITANNATLMFGYSCPGKVMLNFRHAEQPTPAEVMIATRLSTVGSVIYGRQATVAISTTGAYVIVEDDTDLQLVPRACGTEIINSCKYVERSSSSPTFGTTAFNFNIMNGASASAAQTQNILNTETFDWHPFIYYLSGTFSVATPAREDQDLETINKAYGEYSNYTLVSADVMRKIHDTALFSEFGVPQM